MRFTGPKPQPKPQVTRYLNGVALVAWSFFIAACGNVESNNRLNSSDYEIVGKPTPWPSTPTPVPVVKVAEPEIERPVHVLSVDRTYEVKDFETLPDFKLSKTYNVDGLKGAQTAIYGFFGPDPYDRQEYEARLYPDHDTALTLGVDFANEATGLDAEITSATQRWDEGLAQRRTCSANTRGSHHSGRCISAKYGDYVIAGNLVLLCQGRDSVTALKNCEDLYAALQ